jgi:uncharacterized protein (DUF1800 family)
MKRRDFLSASGLATLAGVSGVTGFGSLVGPSRASAANHSGGNSGSAPQPLQTLSSDLSPFTGSFSDTELRHLLRRSMLGVSFAQFTAMKALGGMQPVLDKLLDTSLPLPAKPTPYVDELLLADTTITDPVLKLKDQTNKARLEAMRSTQVRNWWLDLMLKNDTSIREKMALMWSNHFVVGSSVVGHAGYLYQYTQTLRQYALGNLKDFVTAISTDPAMLVYLNGNQNYWGQDPEGNTVGDHVNENFGRELMELFTLGRLDPITQQPNYSELDIQNAGQALSGWQPGTTAPFQGEFISTCHNPGLKTFLGRTGNYALADVLGLIFGKGTPKGYNVAYFVCQKIYTAFVYWIPNPTVVDAMAKLLVSSNWEIAPVMQALLSSAHFYDVNVISAHIKSPIEFIGSVIREFEVTYPPFDPKSIDVIGVDADGFNQYPDSNPTLTYLSETLGGALGQMLLNPPNVKGWSLGADWINERTFPQRQASVAAILKYPITFDGSAAAGNISLAFRADTWAQTWPGAGTDKISIVVKGIESHILGIPPGPLETEDLYNTINALKLPEVEFHYSPDYGALYAAALAEYPEFQLI